MRVALLTSDLSTKHGWGSYSVHLADALQRHGVELKVVSARPNSEQSRDYEHHPLLPSVVPQERFTLAKLLASVPRLVTLLADCDIVHSTIEIFAPLVSIIAGHRPSYITAHGSYINLPRIRRFPVSWLYRWAYKRAQIICVSQYTQSVAQEVVPGIETHVIQNAVDSARFTSITPKRSPYPTIVTAGGVKARKGTLQLVRAVAKVREKIPDVRCHVLGTLAAEPDYVAQVHQEISTLGLTESMRLTGMVSDEAMGDYYASADVFALPSINAGWKFEGFGLATMEASAAGLAVIGTRDCGAEDVIDDGVTGLLISQDQIDIELPEALVHLLTDRQMALEFGQNGRKKATSYTWDDVAQQLITLYESKLNR